MAAQQEDKRFWLNKKLSDFTKEEWEALCDGCGKCCLHKIRLFWGKIAFTNIACKLLDLRTGKCSRYYNRDAFVNDCVKLSARKIRRIDWLPKTCAYRLLNEGKDLPEWHYLVCGDPEAIHKAGVTVAEHEVVCETGNDDLNAHVVKWDDL